MMDNIQAIIADRQYQGALENQNATIRPYKPFPKPTDEEFKIFNEEFEISLRNILDTPIGVFSFKFFCRDYDSFGVVIDFLVQFERIQELEAPDLNSATALIEIALQLPNDYLEEKNTLSANFRKEFGPIAFVTETTPAETFMSKRVQSLDMESEDDYPRSGDKYDSIGNELFPDSAVVITDVNDSSVHQDKMSYFYSPFFGGVKHRTKEAMKEGKESSVDTEFLKREELSRLTLERKRKNKDAFSTDALSDNGEGDFADRVVALQQEEENQKASRKAKALEIFGDLASILEKQAVELLESFQESEEYREMLNLLWYSEQKIEVNDFLMFRDLGRGAFGVVSAAKTKTTGTLTAIKCMNKKLIKGKNAKRLVSAEKAILQVLGDNPSNFTIWLRYSFQDEDYFYMAIPLCTGGDLGFHLKHKFNFPIERAIYHFAEILEGIDHLHKLNIVYRDLKPDNVIFDCDGHARISDMGLAIQTGGRKIRGKAGTPGYWAPEVITHQPYSFSADHWSLGCLLYEMLTGICPFSATNTKMKDRNEGTIRWKVRFPRRLHRKNKDDEPFPEEAKSLILGLLDRDRTRRMGAVEVRNHAFMESIDWFKLVTKQLPVPWKPKNGQIYAPDQIELDFASNDKNYKKIKIAPKDGIKNFEYTSKYAHQLDIIHVLETRELGKLEYDNHYDTGCCECSCM